MENNYTYDAFISYRHTDLDKFVAENLHRMLETYRLPASIRKKHNLSKNNIKRVFRDREELPLASNLEDPIVKALEESEFLIVICSPRLKESKWCRKEIETFTKLHGHQKVFAVLVEGEPKNSFPKELLWEEEEEIDRWDGTTEIIKRPIEPLAADVRGNNKKEVLKALKSEMLRLLAPMFSLNYDDLRQRHKERKMKRIIYTASLISTGCFLFGVYSTYIAMQIHRQQEMLKIHQAKNLAEDALQQLEKDDRLGAIRTAYQALTKYHGVEMPYTSDAQYALTESLHLYDMGTHTKAVSQMQADDIIDSVKVSPQMDMLLSCDEAGQLILWNLKDETRIASYSREAITGNTDRTYCFLDNERIAYIKNNEEVIIADTTDGKEITSIPVKNASGVYADKWGKYLAVNTINTIEFWNGNILERIVTYQYGDDSLIMNVFFSGEETGLLAFTEGKVSSNAAKNETNLYFMNLDKNRTFYTKIKASTVENIRFANGNAYVLCNDDTKTALSMKLMAYHTKNGKQLWESAYSDEFGSFLHYTSDDGSLLAISSYTAHLINAKTGKEIVRLSIGEETVGCFYFKNLYEFLIFAENGKALFIDTVTRETYQLIDLYQLNCKEYKIVTASEDGFLAVPKQDNRIIFYDVITNEDISVYKGDKAILDESAPGMPLDETEIQQMQEKLKLSGNSPVSQMVYNSDKTLLFISYLNDILDIYDMSNQNLKTSISGIKDDLKFYLGEDKFGNIYLSGDNYGYCFNASCECLASMEQLLTIDKEENILIIKDMENFYQVPVYSIEELLDKAKNFL